MSNVASSPVPRIVYLDNLRNYLMLLGVVIHSAQLFRVYSPQAIQLEPRSPIFDYIVATIHAFRLPVFFLVAGFVGSTVIRVRGVQFFMWRRLLRLGLPFIATLLTLNTLEVIIKAMFEGGFRYGLEWNELGRYILRVFEQGHLLHLWFLPALLLYSVVLALSLIVYRRFGSIINLRAALEKLEQSAVYVLLLPLFLVVLDVAAWQCIPFWKSIRWTQLPDPGLLLHYFPFFLFGVIAQFRPLLWSKFGNTSPWYGFAIGGLLVAASLSLSNSFGLASYSLMYLEGIAAWTLAGIVLRFGRKVLDRPQPGILSAPDTAYSVYLFHHFFITVLALIFIKYDASGELLFVLITIAAGILSLASAELVRRVPALRFAFNGRPLAFS